MEIRLQPRTNGLKRNGTECRLNEMNTAKFYEDVMGFVNSFFDDKQINTFSL
jgi:hypothetical protein